MINDFFITTHIPIPWIIPFPHTVIGVEGYEPSASEGIAAGNVISKLLDSETAFGAMRSLMPANQLIDARKENANVFTGSYRLFLGKENQTDWLNPKLQENKIVSPNELAKSWNELIATEIPEGIDLLLPAPRLLPVSVLEQYSIVHHLDDLLHGIACAIRSGLLNTASIPKMLASNTLIPYGNFAANKNIRYEFNSRLWWCAQEFYKNYYKPRTGYQRRVIDFVFERITSMAIIQMAIEKNLSCLSCRNIWVSNDGIYKPTI